MEHLKTLKYYIIFAIISIIMILLNCMGYYESRFIVRTFALIGIYCLGTIMFYFDCKSGLREDTF
jgi:uncharacterized membrane protein